MHHANRTKLEAADAAVSRILDRCSQDPEYFIFKWLKTRDEHDPDNSRKPFPDKVYLRWVLREWHHGPSVVYTAKSRQLMVSWLLAAYGLWTMMFQPDSLVLWQSKKLEDAAPFIYEKTPQHARMSLMLAELPDWLRVAKSSAGTYIPIEDVAPFGSYARLALPNGSQAVGLAQGAAQVEGRVPSLFISDESSLQDEWESAMAAAKPAIEKRAKLLAVGTMRLPSGFGEAIAPSWNVDPDESGRGMAKFSSPEGVYGIRVHYSADPDKDPETPVGAAWKRGQLESGAYKGGEDGWRWQQHMEINPSARAGTLCIPIMHELMDKYANNAPIVVDDLVPAATMGWSFDAGLDWGTLNRAVFLLFGMRPDGRRFLLWEYSRPGGEIGGIPGFCLEIRQCPWFNKVNGLIWSDPTLWNKDQNLQSGLTDKATIFDMNGVSLLPAKANGQEADDVALDRLNNYYWADPDDPLFFICRNATCVLKHWPTLMYEEWSEEKMHERSPKERMKNKNMDEFDAFKYAEVAWPEVPRFVPSPDPGTYGWLKMQWQRKSHNSTPGRGDLR